jgi:hypothetical protein
MLFQFPLIALVLAVVAVVCGVVAVALWLLMVIARKRIETMFEPRPLKLARAFFRREHPHESIAWLRLADADSSRWLVGVYSGETIPPTCKFYAIDRQSGEIVELQECAQYGTHLLR